MSIFATSELPSGSDGIRRSSNRFKLVRATHVPRATGSGSGPHGILTCWFARSSQQLLSNVEFTTGCIFFDGTTAQSFFGGPSQAQLETQFRAQCRWARRQDSSTTSSHSALVGFCHYDTAGITSVSAGGLLSSDADTTFATHAQTTEWQRKLFCNVVCASLAARVSSDWQSGRTGSPASAYCIHHVSRSSCQCGKNT